jgi:hypothetical protein
VRGDASQFQKFHANSHETITVRLGYHKLWSRFIPKMLTDAYEMQRMASAFDFLEQYCKDGDEFLSHHMCNRS